MNGFILVRGIGFLFELNLRVALEKVIVVESDMASNAQPVGDNPELVCITEVSI